MKSPTRLCIVLGFLLGLSRLSAAQMLCEGNHLCEPNTRLFLKEAFINGAPGTLSQNDLCFPEPIVLTVRPCDSDEFTFWCKKEDGCTSPTVHFFGDSTFVRWIIVSQTCTDPGTLLDQEGAPVTFFDGESSVFVPPWKLLPGDQCSFKIRVMAKDTPFGTSTGGWPNCQIDPLAKVPPQACNEFPEFSVIVSRAVTTGKYAVVVQPPQTPTCQGITQFPLICPQKINPGKDPCPDCHGTLIPPDEGALGVTVKGPGALGMCAGAIRPITADGIDIDQAIYICSSKSCGIDYHFFDFKDALRFQWQMGGNLGDLIPDGLPPEGQTIIFSANPDLIAPQPVHIGADVDDLRPTWCPPLTGIQWQHCDDTPPIIQPAADFTLYPAANLRIDHNNDGSITPADETEEACFPGKLVCLGGARQPIQLSFPYWPLSPDRGWSLSWLPETTVAIFTHPSPGLGTAIENGKRYTTSLPNALYIEGAAFGSVTIVLQVFSDIHAGKLLSDDAVSATVIRLDLAVDTNRDGAITTADESGEDSWTKTSGAIFNVNFDKDGAGPGPDAVDFADNGTPTNENFVIESGDEPDITPFIIRGVGGLFPPEVKFFLKVAELEDAKAIHLFRKIAAGENSIFGGFASSTTEIDLTPYLDPTSPQYVGSGSSGDATFGLEGLLFRNTTPGILEFDGQIDLTLEARRNAQVLCSDTVAMKVAPWIGQPNTQTSFETWATDLGSSNDEFLHTSAAPPGCVGIDDSGQLHTPTSGAGSQWTQDHVEVGWTQRPGGPKIHEVFRLPYGGIPTWPMNATVLKPETGVFQIGQSLGAGAGDFGGNIEVLPPTSSHPLGQLVAGNTASPELIQFFTDQEVQAPVIRPSTAWLRVGHVDETIGFSSTNGQVIVSDTNLAYSLMNAIPVADRGKAVFFATGAAPASGTVATATTTNNRINTGFNHTIPPYNVYNYLRIYRGGAAGQVAHISTKANGYVLVDLVQKTTSKIIPTATGTLGDPCIYTYTEISAPQSTSWFVLPFAGDKFTLVEGSRTWHPGTLAIVTVAEVLADADFQNLNLNLAKGELDSIKTTLTASASNLSFVSVPVLYFGVINGLMGGSFQGGRSALAMTPGASNFQLASLGFYFPAQFGFLNSSGIDAFKLQIGAAVPGALSVDCWDAYHARMGEVHCGTASFRNFPTLNWWTNQP